MDLFINRLPEGTKIKNTDYTVFDVANTTTGSFSTQKISYASLTRQLSSDISANVKTLIDGLQSNINTTNANLANKLDKRGLTFNPNEKVTGTLFINASLCATGLSYFSNTVSVNNNFISNVKDPVLDYDAVNKRTLLSAISGVSPINGSLFLNKSGDEMIGGDLKLFRNPTQPLHATTMQYVTGQINTVQNSINSFGRSLSAYIPLSGGNMTGGFITAATEAAPTNTKHLTNKKYVDDQITNRTSNFVTITNADTLYVKKAGDTMTGSLVLKGFSEKTGTATSTGTVTLNLNLGNTFPIILAGNITGFALSNVPTDSFSITIIVTQAATGGPFNVNFSFTGYTVKWSNASAPVITTTANKTDIFCFTRVGTTIYAFNGGQNF
jgi:hypothetical protein